MLRRLARRETNAEQKDRLMAAALAIEQVPTGEIQRVLNRSRGFVQRGAYAYRERGIAARNDKPRGGSGGRISAENALKLMVRIDAGPTPADKACTLRGKDVQRILREEMGVKLSLNASYATLHTMGYSCLAPRPRHEKQDLEAQRTFTQDRAPPCVKLVREALTPPGGRVRVFFVDEAGSDSSAPPRGCGPSAARGLRGSSAAAPFFPTGDGPAGHRDGGSHLAAFAELVVGFSQGAGHSVSSSWSGK